MINAQQIIKVRIWNGRDFKQPIPDHNRDDLIEQALEEATRQIEFGHREGRFELSVESNDLYYCSWQVELTVEASQ